MSNGNSAQEMTASTAMWTMLQEEGIDCIFGVCGITNVPMLHDLYAMEGIRFIRAAHEAAATRVTRGQAIRMPSRLAVLMLTL